MQNAPQPSVTPNSTSITRCFDGINNDNESDVIKVQDLLASNDVTMNDENGKQSGYRSWNNIEDDGDDHDDDDDGMSIELQFEEEVGFLLVLKDLHSSTSGLRGTPCFFATYRCEGV